MVRFKVFYYCFIGICLAGCELKPSNIIPVSVDVKLGELLLNQTLAENSHLLLDSLHLNAKQKECITNFKRLSHSSLVSNKQNFEWTVHFIKDDSTINAFCIPGGHLFVYTGLLNLCTSKDEIAGVLAHEIAHAEKRHSINQLAQQLGFQMILESILGLNSSWLGLGAQLMQLKFSRADELEADQFAYYLLKDKNYNTDALLTFFNKMNQLNQVHVLEFMSTHPETENRIQAIKQLKLENEK